MHAALAALLLGPLAAVSAQAWAASHAAEPSGPSAPPAPMTSRLIETPDNLRVELRAQRASALQALERQMSLRGQELLAQSLCRFTPTPGKRLVAALRGVQVVHSFEQEGWMELTLQVPRQTPTCEVREVAVAVPRETVGATPAPASTSAAPAPVPPLSVPAAANDAAAPITVRRSKGEF